jgi:hypothetical protein
LETSIGSSSEANLPVDIKPTESKKSIIDPLNEIMEHFDFNESSNQSLPDVGSSTLRASFKRGCFSSISYWRSCVSNKLFNRWLPRPSCLLQLLPSCATSLFQIAGGKLRQHQQLL